MFLVCLTTVFADNTVTFNFADEDGNAVQNVHVYVFECTDFTCSELTGTSIVDSLEWGSSGSNSFYEVNVPKVTGTTWYAAYIFGHAYDDEFLPKYQKFYFDGDGADLGEEDIILEKATDCQSEIQSFTLSDAVLNEPITLSTEVESALHLTSSRTVGSLLSSTASTGRPHINTVYPWGYDSSEAGGRYNAWYSSETDVELNIKKAWSINDGDGKEYPFESSSSSPFESSSGPFSSTTYVTIDTQTETLDILAGETETVTFTWTPEEENDYRVVLTTTVTDAQCGSTDDDTETEDFTVEEDEEDVTEWPTDDWDFDWDLPDFDIEPSISSCSADPITAEIGEDIQFDVTTALFSTWLTDVSYAWDFGDGNTEAEAAPVHSYSTAGAYTAFVTVTDDDGEYDTCSVDVEISEPDTEPENSAPTLDCSALPREGNVDEEITLAVTATDSDSTISDYDWDFGDGAVDSTPDDETTHTYTSAETYTIYVEITDDYGNTASCSADIEITEAGEIPENKEPVAICNGPYEGIVSETITFDGSGSYDSDGYVTSASWNFGDGAFASEISFTGALTEEQLEAEYAYKETGVFTVTLTVFDEDGAYNTCETTATITEETIDDDGIEGIDNPAVAVASADPTSGEPTLWVQFSSEGSSGDEPLRYYWTFGDGEHSTRPNPGHYYNKEGTYTATVTVTDADGNSDSDSVTITVGDELENIAGRHYYVDGIAMSNDGIVEAGNTLELYMTTENIADMDKDTVAFNAIIQELGIYETTAEMNMDAGEKEAVVLYIDIPSDTEPGSYYVRITISDDYVKRVIYRDIIVTD